MKEIFFATREEWLAWRRGGIGATDAALLAASVGLVEPAPWMEAEAEQVLFWDKLGMSAEKAPNAAMKRGLELEEKVRKIVEERIGEIVLPVYGESEDLPWARASFDGVTFAGDIVEIKVPSASVVDLAKSGKIVEYYLPQLSYQALVAWGLPKCWPDRKVMFCVWDDMAQNVVIVEANKSRLREVAEAIIPIAARFWECVENKTHPVVSEWGPLAEALSSAKEKVSLVEQAKEYLKGEVANGYDPKSFFVRKIKPRRVKKVNWAAVVQEVGVSQEALDVFRRPSVWVVSGGKEVSAVLTPERAEKILLEAKRIEEEYESLAQKAKDLARELNRTLVGPYGLRVFERSGAVDYKEAAKALGWDADVIDAHTREVDVSESISFVAK